MKQLIILLLLMTTLPLRAQEMVKAVKEDGLEKTVSYDVAKFLDVRDKKLEDVLRKMPGVQLQDFEGYIWISYNGRDVDKIYVNGMDILEGNYQPVYNMKPEDVERLEITENHTAIRIMKGREYNNTAAINVVLKKGESDWSGSIKGGLGSGTDDLLVNADVNAMNMGEKVQTTVLFKADNTGLLFSGPLAGFDWEWEWGEPSTTKYDYTIPEYLYHSPDMAPLSADRTRINKSGIANIGSTIKLNDEYQLNMQLTYHTDRFRTSSFDETTYYMSGGQKRVDTLGEDAKYKQQDIQTDFTLLANTEDKYLHNQLSFSTRWIDLKTINTGDEDNIQQINMTPMKLKNDFVYKTHLGSNILSINSEAGFYFRPQDIDVDRVVYPFYQNIKSRSYFINASATYDILLKQGLTLSLNGGASANRRELEVERTNLPILPTNPIESTYNIWNAHMEGKLTYITERLQAELRMPVKYGDYTMKDKLLNTEMSKQKVYWEPKLNVKYEASKDLSLGLNAKLIADEIDRKETYPGIIIKMFDTANKGYAEMRNETGGEVELTAQYKNTEASFFLNGDVEYQWNKNPFVPSMEFSEFFDVNGHHVLPYTSDEVEIRGDISKGIPFMKGKIGLAVEYENGDSKMARNDVLIPFTNRSLTLSPYINGRLTPWMNMIYRMDYSLNQLKMSDEDTTSDTKEYKHTLELIFHPWEKLNFSVLGEHYYTEFTDDMSKHLVLMDVKAEYNLSDKWQLILSARNLLNQKEYNYTVVNAEDFTKSFTSYQIRGRDVLLSLYYKF